MGLLWVAVLALASLAGAQEIQTVQVASGITAPTDIQNAGDGSGRLFFVQQDGVVRLFRGGEPFLDIRGKVRSGGEQGLLGLAFPPGFAQKQRFYVNYTDLNGDTVIAQYRVSANPDRADAASETVLLRIDQPFANHNGGQVRFGPDGYLYIGHGRRRLRRRPHEQRAEPGDAARQAAAHRRGERSRAAYAFRPDNPFVSTAGARPEIWAYGLRNPWRFSFDRATRDLWIADVGQNTYEEVNFQPASSGGGENYGWNRMEGAHCFLAGCSTQGLTLPVAEYGRADGCSVTRRVRVSRATVAGPARRVPVRRLLQRADLGSGAPGRAVGEPAAACFRLLNHHLRRGRGRRGLCGQRE